MLSSSEHVSSRKGTPFNSRATASAEHHSISKSSMKSSKKSLSSPKKTEEKSDDEYYSNEYYSYSSHHQPQEDNVSKSKSSIKSKQSPSNKSARKTASVRDILISGQSSSVQTDSIYTHSFHGKVDSPKPQGPPPLKRTFIDDSSDSDNFGEIDDFGDSHSHAFVYRKPDWKFPVKRVTRNEDEGLYDTLRERFSVKNIVSKLKRTQ